MELLKRVMTRAIVFLSLIHGIVLKKDADTSKFDPVTFDPVKAIQPVAVSPQQRVVEFQYMDSDHDGYYHI